MHSVRAVDRQIPTIACWLLVLVRLAIGWHLMYEGLWKLQTQHTAAPWSAEGYLKNATGPFRDHFRDLTGDPNDLNWLNYNVMSNRWRDWETRFKGHYFGRTDSEANQALSEKLKRMLHGQESFAVKLENLPDSVASAVKENVIIKAKVAVGDGKTDERPVLWRDPDQKRLVVDGNLHLLPDELKKAKEFAPDDEPYVKALDDLFKQQSKLSYDERLAVLLKGDPERIGVLQKDAQGDVIENRIGEIDLYKQRIQRYEDKLRQSRQDFQWDHLNAVWKELQDQRRQLVGPVQALEAELKEEAEKLLTAAHLAHGPPREPMTQMRRINLQTMWALVIIGGLLIAGLFTRLASLAGAGLLMMFYLAMPPWPGTPPEIGIEHNFIVNKVLIEALVLLAFTVLPSGRWFGIDAVFGAMFGRWWRSA
jgi:uncharacterized membrane protein YphA (DoxX/SURF4 family)